MIERVSKLRNYMAEFDIDGIFIMNPYNRRYISGFTGTSGYVILTQDRKLFITDFRYNLQAKKECIDYEIVIHNDTRTIYDIINDLNIKSLGFEEEYVTYSQYCELKSKLREIELVELKGILNKLRMIKSDDEIENIRMAARIADKAFNRICKLIKPGITERDIALELEFYIKKLGATSTSFTSIVASGERSALPHGTATDKKIKEGEFLTLDFGCVYNGYCSDMTRTVVIGKANERQREIYSVVLEAQEKALKYIKPGVKGCDVDRVARDIIKEKGFGQYFGHGLGHSLGLEIHESPRLSPTSNDILQEGMVVTDEPGIYIPDFGGVRIEDLVLVTTTGFEVLSNSPKELIEL